MTSITRLLFRHSRCIFVSAALLPWIAGPQANGQLYWQGLGDSAGWEDTGNWSGGALPTAGSDVIFGQQFGSGTTILLNGDRAVSSLTVETTAFFQLGNGTDSLTIGSGIINRTPASSGQQIIMADLILGGDDVAWNIEGDEDGSLVLFGSLSGSLNVTKTGTGELVLAGANNAIHRLAIAEGNVVAGNSVFPDNGITLVIGDGTGAAGSANLRVLGPAEVENLELHSDGGINFGSVDAINSITVWGGTWEMGEGKSIRAGEYAALEINGGIVNLTDGYIDGLSITHGAANITGLDGVSEINVSVGDGIGPAGSASITVQEDDDWYVNVLRLNADAAVAVQSGYKVYATELRIDGGNWSAGGASDLLDLYNDRSIRLTGGSLTLNGSQSLPYLAFVNSGTLVIGDGAAMAQTSNLVLGQTSGGPAILDLGSHSIQLNRLMLNATGSIQFTGAAENRIEVSEVLAFGGGTHVFDNTGLIHITDTAEIRIFGGEVTINGPQTYTGDTTLLAVAHLRISGDENLGNLSSNLVLGDEATVTLLAPATIERLVLLRSTAPNSMPTIDTGANAVTIAGGMADDLSAFPAPPGAFRKAGTGTLSLTGSSSHSGGTIISAGEIDAKNDSALGTGAVTVENGGTLKISQGYSLDNDAMIESGGFLVGSGLLLGVVTTESGAHIAPGDSPGTLTLGDLDVSLGAEFDFELGTISDLLQVNGLLTGSGPGELVINFSNAGGLSETRYTVITFGSSTELDLGDFTLGDTPFGYSGIIEIDGNSIVLSVYAVPEPGLGTLFVLGTVCLSLVRTRRRRDCRRRCPSVYRAMR